MIKSSTTNKEARRLAKKSLAEAKENEPNIKADLQMIASAVSAQIVGLESKFKSEESLTRKLIDKSYGSLSKLPKKAVTITDVLRYTFVLPIEKYTGWSLVMEYVILRDEETGEIEKLGRFRDTEITERFYNGEWIKDRILYSELFDGLLENISEAEAAKIIAQQQRREKIAA